VYLIVRNPYRFTLTAVSQGRVPLCRFPEIQRSQNLSIAPGSPILYKLLISLTAWRIQHSRKNGYFASLWFVNATVTIFFSNE
jgi:hypothetical protein